VFRSEIEFRPGMIHVFRDVELCYKILFIFKVNQSKKSGSSWAD